MLFDYSEVKPYVGYSLFFFGVGVVGAVCVGILAGLGIPLPSFAGCFEGGVDFLSGSFAITFQEI
jgi:hypothetical protein